jgi:hypothetical protein
LRGASIYLTSGAEPSLAVVIAADRQDRPPISAENLPVSLTNEIGAGVDCRRRSHRHPPLAARMLALTRRSQ